MYHAIINGVQHSMERLRYIKRQSNGLFVLCSKEEAQGITVDGENYALQGHDIGLPIVYVFWNDDMEQLMRENEALKAAVDEERLDAIEAYIVTHEYETLMKQLEE